ncbi:MAG: T9SS type A sorting domain-containing protein [Bacteroidota bacterium]
MIARHLTRLVGLCSLALLLALTHAAAQDAPPIAWEVVDDFLQVDNLAVSGDSVIYLSGNDGTWVWRRSEPGQFLEINDGRRFFHVLMASSGLFFLEGNRTIRRSTYSLRDTPEVVDGGRAVIETHSGAIVVATDLAIARSTDGGDTWTFAERPASIWGRSFALSPPTPDLPHGRLVLAGLNGAAVSTDDGLTWQASNLAQFFGYDSEHVVYSGFHDAFYTYMNGPVEDGGSEKGVVRESRDGVVWTTRGRLPTDGIGFIGHLAAGPDGSLWGIMRGAVDTLSYGAVYRSEDRGATWANVGQFDGRDLVGTSLKVWDAVVDWEGRVWVGFSQGSPGLRTDGAVLRTVEPVAASGEEPALPADARLLRGVYPNPASGRVQVAVALPEPQAVRVRVVDLLGRTVAAVHEGVLAGDRTFTVPTAAWAPGVYVAEVHGRDGTETRRFTVVR